MYSQGYETYNPSLMAQLLNDEGAHEIELGDFEQAIGHLVKALHLYESFADKHETCKCEHCRLEFCIAKSRRSSSQNQELPPDTDTDTKEVAGYIYKQPIYCSPTFSHEDHHPGITLLMMIVFNLALAHHLLSISPYRRRILSTNKAVQLCVSKSLQLYELFYKLQTEREIYSTSAMLAVANNVGEIHRVAGNISKYKLCLEHLMSCIMLVIEDQRVLSTTSSDTNNSSSSSSSTFPINNSSDSKISCDKEDMEGFLRNASQLVLLNNTAAAA